MNKLELVKLWVANSTKKLSTFADTSHRFWICQSLLPKDSDFKFWHGQKKAMINNGMVNIKKYEIYAWGA